jgi:hypothetical protein
MHVIDGMYLGDLRAGSHVSMNLFEEFGWKPPKIPAPYYFLFSSYILV